MNNFVHRMLGHFFMAEAGEGGDPGAGAAAATAPAATVLDQGNTTTDYIPEKYRVNGADGKLDLEQSSRKLAESYSHLEKRFGSGDAPPKTAEEYAPKIEVEGFNFDEFKADETGKSFLKGAHAKGLTNDQVSYVIGEYLKAAPGLVEGGAILSQQDCTAALKTVWADDQSMKAGVSASYRAAQAFASEGTAPGNFDALMAKYGNDPDFIAFTANIGKELREDVPVSGNPASEADFAVKAAELRKQLEEMPIHDPKRAAVKAQLDGMYASRYPTGGGKFK
ncbi:hypothetical protein DBR00_11515 [Pseudomonas sp. HMWF032]|uniref:hypothetical protein n=1 Tax=Pseudomonas sp. HMWF032 TaxID=2056866 RepID=UPI000D3D586F|nr:hypothetical protein [Pseudomonas sp. HMWF032]PTS84001.1 hypothetical protein DBR00_11515 [Pseudomonas sp. HMWF032]PTT85356.1 hypothetical protein DBR41_04100 [Pseudomonas sp. HMWF010]